MALQPGLSHHALAAPKFSGSLYEWLLLTDYIVDTLSWGVCGDEGSSNEDTSLKLTFMSCTSNEEK